MLQISSINDLSRHTRPLSSLIKNKVNSIIDSGWYVLGKEVELFEQSYSDYCGVKYCVTVANGTDALELSIKSLNLGNNPQIATVANAGMYSTTAILACGGSPLFIDVSKDTLNLCPHDLEKKIKNNKIDCIIVTHLFGQLANIKQIMAIAKNNNIPVIEDCAQAHGAKLNGQKAGSFGDVGCFSFYPTKNLGALGDGGAVVTNSKSIYNDLIKLRQYGWDKKYHVVKSACRNSRLDEIQAGILNIKLPYLDLWNDNRRAIVKKVTELCADLKNISFPGIFDEQYVGHLFVVRTEKRDTLREFLKTKNIHSDIHYPIPDHKQLIMKIYISDDLNLKNTESSCDQILTLPCFPEMTSDEVTYLANSLIEYEKCCL